MWADLELWVDGHWQTAARLEALGDADKGILGKVALEYDADYAKAHYQATGSRALSCLYPPTFELWTESPWPAFLFDILPAGAARRSMLARMALPDTREADWTLLAHAQFPPGNLRVRPRGGEPVVHHEGFERAEVVARGPDFVEYAFSRGAPVTGSTGAQGDAPKFLLCEDRTGRWHAEGAVPDEHAASHWLVKFPRGRHETDLAILAEEERYMELARYAGLRANASLSHEEGCLFVPRFDRQDGDRLGLETVASLSRISAYGQTQSLQASARALAQVCTNPAKEVRELLLRDVFNLAVGNTDNHVRNTSVLKHPDGHVALSPIYDLAPMLLDRAGIPRACRWGERERAGTVDWALVIEDLESLGIPGLPLREGLGAMAEVIGSLAKRMRELGVNKDLIARLEPAQRSLAHELSGALRQ